jgi:hypothetical protein
MPSEEPKADVGVQVVPDDQQRTAVPLMRGAQQPGVASLGEALAPVRTGAAAAMAVSVVAVALVRGYDPE